MAASPTEPSTATLTLFALQFYGAVAIGAAGVVARSLYVLIRRVQNPVGRPWPKATWHFFLLLTVQCLLICAGVWLFRCALDEPAARTANFLGGGTQVQQGWVALVIGFPFWGMNAWFLLALFWLALIGVFRDALRQLIVLAVQVTTCVVIWEYAWQDNSNLPGFEHWFAAHRLVAIAYAIPSAYGPPFLRYGRKLTQKYRLWRYAAR